MGLEPSARLEANESRAVDAQFAPAQPRDQGSALDDLVPAVPDHKLLRVIGRGAYGEVWLARHTRLGTLRAVKILRLDQFGDARPFQREFEGIQRYEPISRGHPNLVNILHVGGTEEWFYYVMELADSAEGNGEVAEPGADGKGLSAPYSNASTFQLCASYSPRTLRSELKQHGALSIDRCVEIAQSLAGALAYLHRQNLVHRDVKPSNIIFVGRVPKLADVGLVAAVEESRSFVGTEGYIPPEGPGTPSADCYSLGKVLYELSTGHDRTAWPEPPADLTTRHDRVRLLELNAILHRACAPELCERYANGEAMLADLELLKRGHSLKRRHKWHNRLAACRKFGRWGSLVLVAALASFLLTRRLGEGDMRSAVPEVNNLVEQGSYCVRNGSDKQGLIAADLFQRAIKLDPTFVPAHFGLFLTYMHRGAFKADASPELRRGLEAVAARLAQIAPNLSESRQASAAVKWSNWKFQEALANMRAAIRMRAACKVDRADAHIYYGFLLLQSGKPADALVQFRIAEQLDPAKPTTQHMLGHVYLAQRKFDLALAQYQKSLEIEPTHALGHFWAGRAYEETGGFMDAIREFETYDRSANGGNAEPKRFYDDLREAVRRGGAQGYWGRRLEVALAKSSPDYYDIATYYARLGHKEKAYEWLRKACEKRAFNQGLLFDLCWDHNDPEFQEIARGIGLLQ